MERKAVNQDLSTFLSISEASIPKSNHHRNLIWFLLLFTSRLAVSSSIMADYGGRSRCGRKYARVHFLYGLKFTLN